MNHDTISDWCCACEADIAKFESLILQAREEGRREVLEEAIERLSRSKISDKVGKENIEIILSALEQLKNK